jgi:hypothetical protein
VRLNRISEEADPQVQALLSRKKQTGQEIRQTFANRWHPRIQTTNSLVLGDHLKTGHTLSLQNRPTGTAEDVIVLPCRSVRLQGAD